MRLSEGNRPPLFPLDSTAPVQTAPVQPLQISSPNTSVKMSQESVDSLLTGFKNLLIDVKAGCIFSDYTREKLPITISTSAPLPELTDLELLRKFLRAPDAQFRSPGQAVALGMLIRPEKNALFALATGSGKSMLCIATAFYLAKYSTKKKYIALLVPYVELINDIVRRCDEYGLPVLVLEFGPGTSVDSLVTNTSVTLVLISADKFACGKTAQEYLALSVQRRLLHCIVMDEAQVFLDPIRSPLKGVPKLLEGIGCKVILNSGSLSLRAEDDIKKSFCELARLCVRSQLTVLRQLLVIFRLCVSH